MFLALIWCIYCPYSSKNAEAQIFSYEWLRRSLTGKVYNIGQVSKSLQVDKEIIHQWTVFIVTHFEYFNTFYAIYSLPIGTIWRTLYIHSLIHSFSFITHCCYLLTMPVGRDFLRLGWPIKSLFPPKFGVAHYNIYLKSTKSLGAPGHPCTYGPAYIGSCIY